MIETIPDLVEYTYRQKLGCYRCITLNSSCHLTCIDYIPKPKRNDKL